MSSDSIRSFDIPHEPRIGTHDAAGALNPKRLTGTHDAAHPATHDAGVNLRNETQRAKRCPRHVRDLANHAFTAWKAGKVPAVRLIDKALAQNGHSRTDRRRILSDLKTLHRDKAERTNHGAHNASAN